tara:strand:- start:797 stop:1657 length:861 start_codon:yes stop_codon:yes gene_type:complete
MKGDREGLKKVVLVGDFSLESQHFGCHLTSQTFREQFLRVGLDLIASLPINLDSISSYKMILGEADLVVINGEGAIHNGRYKEIINLSSEYPCVLVNCVYQNNPLNENLKRFKLVSSRESLSAEALALNGINVSVTPDVVFASTYLRSFKPQNSIKNKKTGFTDCAKKSEFRFGPFCLKYRLGYSPKAHSLYSYLNFLYSHEKIAVGRLHAAVCCSVMGIPFSTWESNTWKMKGLMLDMGIPELHYSNRRDALDNIPKEIPGTIIDYAITAKKKVESLFDKMALLA